MPDASPDGQDHPANASLSLQRVGVDRGIAWAREAWRAFASKPFAFAALLAALLTGALLLSMFGWLGALLVTMALPLVSLVFMVATQGAITAPSRHPFQSLGDLRALDRRRARALITLCVLYALGMSLLLYASVSIDQGGMQRLIELFAEPRTPASVAEIDRLLASDALQDGVAVRLIGTLLLSVPFWHAPALVWWGRQGAWQSMFSSTLGVLRNAGAYVLYALTLMATALGLTTVVGIVLSLVGSPSTIRVAIAALAMVMAVVFYVSLWFSFADTFGMRRAGAPIPDAPLH